MGTLASPPTTQTHLNLPNVLMRLEGLALLAAAVALYAHQGYGWLALVLLLVAPDLALIAYLLNRRVGVAVYNFVHTLTLPLVLGVFGVWTGQPLWTQMAVGWAAHIGMDRTLGLPLR